jgi:hypothetical protein
MLFKCIKLTISSTIQNSLFIYMSGFFLFSHLLDEDLAQTRPVTRPALNTCPSALPT